MYFVYILRSEKDNKHYTGITNDLRRRLKEHNERNGSTPSTKNRGPFELVYYEIVENRKIAREREKYFKSGIGREYIKNTQD
ncbi:MAG: GIY-YIG nuclease family protein [Candidatus Parcubacteria bacterium]|nr:GIY-YIG nuclease family protein [Candidatus Parcubacteria bacterium]